MSVGFRPDEVPFEAFRDTVKMGVKVIGESFTNPDDDWTPVLMIWGRKGMDVVGIDGRWFNTTQGKDELAKRVLPREIAKRGATMFAFVQSVWMVQIRVPDDDPEAQVQFEQALADAQAQRIHQRADRVEMVHLFAADRFRVEMWHAPIARSPFAPPTLGEWVLFGEGDPNVRFEWGSYSSRFVKPLIRALRPQG